MFSSAGGGPPPPATSARIPSPSVAMVQQQQPQQQQQQQQQQSQLPSSASAAVALSDCGPHPNGHQLASSSPDSANNNHPHHHLKSVGPSSVITTSSTTTAAASMAALSPEAASLSTSPVVYGELIILGYNGSLPQGEKGRRRSKYQLMRRLAANGIKKSKHYSVKQPQTSKAIQDKDLHSISFTLCRSQAIIVEYQHDEETDMFQIGRSSENPIDFVVIDTVMLDPSRSSSAHSSSSSQHRAALNGNGHHHHHHHQQNHHPQQQPHNSNHSSSSDYLSAPSTTAMATGHPFASPPKPVQQSTISRFACRILVDRRPPYCARIYAAGFDSSKNIFLGEKATKWQANGEIDGLTTNGILIMHPKRPFLSRRTSKPDQQQPPPDLDEVGLLFGEQLHIGSNGAGQPPPQPPPGQGHLGGVWREVSVCGEIYSVRETRSASQKGVRIEAETNVLQDGTLIDLCGATLMWRSAEGLRRSPTRRHLEEMIDALNASRPQCPVGLNTLVIPRRASAGGGGGGVCGQLAASLAAGGSVDDEKQPYVYLNCGHVQGYHDWGHVKADGSAKDKGNGGGGGGGGGNVNGGAVGHSSSSVRTCPMCFKSGPVVRLTMGIEPSFWASSATPSYAFNPCGHMASETTTSYWSQVLIPHGTNGFHAMCPFCATPLGGETGYVKLIFQ